MLDTQLKVIAVIPARGESESAAGLNLRTLEGKPLIVHAIEAAKSSPLIQRVIVTTNNQEIANVAERAGAEIPFLRRADLSEETSTTEQVLQHAVLWLDKHENYHADIVAYLTATSPFRDHAWVNEVVRKLLDDPSLDSAFVVHRNFKNYWRSLNGNWVRLAPDIVYASRLMRESLYEEETPVACASRAALIRQARRVGPHVELIVTDDRRASLKIEDEFDFWLAEKIMAEWPMSRPLPRNQNPSIYGR